MRAKTYGACSAPKHDTMRSLEATSIDYRAGSVNRRTRALEPQGVDYVFDAVRGAKEITPGRQGRSWPNREYFWFSCHLRANLNRDKVAKIG